LKVDMDGYSTFYVRLLVFLGGLLDFEPHVIRRSTGGKWHIILYLPQPIHFRAQAFLRFLFLDDMWRTFLDGRRLPYFQSVLFTKKTKRYLPNPVRIRLLAMSLGEVGAL
jgi:hypothetical protein